MYTLDLIHSDVDGPVPTKSINGCRYFLTFIDDCSRYRWIYFMKLKSDFFETFKSFKAIVENRFNKNIKSIISDGGGEYVKIYVQNFCESEGIRMEHSVPYTPQQNGVVERKNRPLKKMATFLLHAKHLPPYLWAEAVKCASYLHNRVPHKSVVGVTPFEALHGYKPNVSHMRVFGSKSWARIPLDKRKAFQAQSRESVHSAGICR